MIIMIRMQTITSKLIHLQVHIQRHLYTSGPLLVQELPDKLGGRIMINHDVLIAGAGMEAKFRRRGKHVMAFVFNDSVVMMIILPKVSTDLVVVVDASCRGVPSIGNDVITITIYFNNDFGAVTVVGGGGRGCHCWMLMMMMVMGEDGLLLVVRIIRVFDRDPPTMRFKGFLERRREVH